MELVSPEDGFLPPPESVCGRPKRARRVSSFLTEADPPLLLLPPYSTDTGSDTTADGISTFLLTMVAHPHVQAKAQEELDRVVGRARMPEFSDQEDLVYCQAVVREILRWRTVVAGGLAHATTEDDWYEGEFRRAMPVGEADLLVLSRLLHSQGYLHSCQPLGHSS